MRSIIALVCLLVSIASANAQQPKTFTTILNEIQTQIVQNNRQAITGTILNSILQDMIYFSNATVPSETYASAYGVVSDPTCQYDNTTPLRNAIAASYGKHLVLPAGTMCLNQAHPTLELTQQIDISGQGAGTILMFNAPTGPYEPTIRIMPSSTNVSIHDFTVEGNAQAGGGNFYTDSDYFGCVNCTAGPWGDNAINVEGDYSSVHNMVIRHGFVNCIGIGAVNSSGVYVAQSPKLSVISDVQTFNCGAGVSHIGIAGHNGASIDNGGGLGTVITNIVDYQSYNGIVSDIGDGASATWSNIYLYNTQVDSSQPNAGSGSGMYIGGAQSSFNNIIIWQPGANGIFFDYYAGDSTDSSVGTPMNNITVKAPAHSCLYMKGAGLFTNFSCLDASTAGNNLYDGILIQSGGGPYPISGLTMTNTLVSGTNLRTGLNVDTTYGGTISGYVQFSAITGVSAGYVKSAVGTSGLHVQTQNKLGVGFDTPSASFPFDFFNQIRMQAPVANKAYGVCAFGDICSDTTINGNVLVTDFANAGNKLGMGYDPTNDFFVMQAIQQGVAAKPLALNPSNGDVLLGRLAGTQAGAVGFPSMPAAAGPPLDVPVSRTGGAQFYYDKTNDHLFIWNSATNLWKQH